MRRATLLRPRALLLALLLAPVAAADDPAEASDRAWRDGDVATALTAWSDQLRLARERGDSAAVVEAALRLAAAHRSLGRVRTAADVLDLGARHVDDDPLRRARLDIGYGHLALDLGDPAEAERRLGAAFDAMRRLGEPDGAATAALSLGLARAARGDTDGAMSALGAAATLFETLADHDGHADALTSRGTLALRRGAPRDARSDLERALALYGRTGNTGGVIDATTGLGRTLEALGHDDLAAARYAEALEAARSRADLARQATLLHNLGAIAHRDGAADEARTRYAAAERAWRAAGHPDQAVAVALSRVLLDGGAPSALERVREDARDAGSPRVEALAALALADRVRTEAPEAAHAYVAHATTLAERLDHRDLLWRARYVSGLLARDAGDRDAARDAFRGALDLIERAPDPASGEPGPAGPIGRDAAYRALADLHLHAGETAAAFAVVERMHRIDHADVREEPSPGRAEQRFVAERLRDAERIDPDSEAATALRERLATLRVTFASEVDRLRAASPDFDRRVRVAPEDLEAAQARLEPGVTVLQPILFDDRLVLLVFRHDTLEARVVPVAADQVREAVALLTRSLRAGLTTRPEWTALQAERLGEWLIAPIADALADTETLVIAATDPFRTLPFALLRHDDAWLVDRVAIVGVTHVGSLAERPPGAAAPALDGASVLLVGDPDGTLPGAIAEVRAIAERLPGAQVLEGADGTAEALARHATGRLAVHLATHGRLDTRHPERSHLVLAGSPDRLAYQEIPGLAPWLAQCRLVVLSACESGLPIARSEGSEEGGLPSINGLAAQFRRAGVETLVATLWRVDDDSTRALMVGFYDALASGRDVAAALREAQRIVRSTPRWEHPWYWSGFVVVGDWRTVGAP